ncbi:MAG: DUF2857 domain-containing protein [Gammaproteobacteria bacterium]|nr:DUF2857 domain-containing protein [Gammaproteobacteria bacterium]MDH5653004.1 DUF2857 domain-containing protein [Gammaproteobacteria bacterium]
MPRHDSDLAYHVLMYAIHALAEGDLKSITKMGFTIDEIQQISQLPAKSIKHLARLSDHFLVVTPNHDSFTRIMAHVKQELAQDQLQDELLRLEAPITMMQTLYGMSTAEYLQRHTLLGLSSRGAGRPRHPSEEDQVSIWESWLRSEGKLLPERYIQVAEETKQPLRALWSLLQAWESERVQRNTKSTTNKFLTP